MEPKIFSTQENLTPCLYSNPWQNKNTNPKQTVRNKFQIKRSILFFNNIWWAYVIVTPDESNKIVLIRGNPKTSRT